MPEDNKNAGTPDGGTVTTTQPGTPGATDVATTASAADVAGQWRNPAEIGKALKATREANEKLEQKLDAFIGKFETVIQGIKPPEKPKEQTPPPTVDASAEVKELRHELAFKDAASKFTLSDGQREVLERLRKAEKPSADDLPGWLAKNVAALGAGQSATPPATPPPQGHRVDTGPPAPPSQETLPANLFRMSKAQVDGLSKDEFRKRLAEHKAANGGRKKHLFD